MYVAHAAADVYVVPMVFVLMLVVVDRERTRPRVAAD